MRRRATDKGLHIVSTYDLVGSTWATYRTRFQVGMRSLGMVQT